MSASQKTPNYNLPLFAPEDVTDWLTDFNGAMSMIDGDLHGLASSITKTQTASGELDTRVGALEGEYNTLNTQVTNNSSSLSNLTQRTTTNEEAIQNLENEYSELSGEVAQNEATITSQQGTLSSLDTTVQSHQTTIVQNTTEIQGINSTLATTNNTIKNIDEEIKKEWYYCGRINLTLKLGNLPQEYLSTKTSRTFHLGLDNVKVEIAQISGEISPTDKIIVDLDLHPQILPPQGPDQEGQFAVLYPSIVSYMVFGTNRLEEKGLTLAELNIDESTGLGTSLNWSAHTFTRLIAGLNLSESEYGLILRGMNPTSFNYLFANGYTSISGRIFKKKS